jgi:sulfur-carrier protein
MKIVYFASIREAIGRDEEHVEFPDTVDSINDAIDFLALQSERHIGAFSERMKLRFALDQQMAKGDAPLGSAYELAIFPPVTGG